MNQETIKVVFVQDSLEEKVVALEGNTFAILDRGPHLPAEQTRTFCLSTMISTDKLSAIADAKQTAITGNLVRFEFVCSKKDLNQFLLSNFTSLHFQ